MCGETGSDSAGVVGAGAAEEEAERKFGLKVYLAVLRQPVVLGLACTTVVDGFGKPVFLTYVPQYLVRFYSHNHIIMTAHCLPLN